MPLAAGLRNWCCAAKQPEADVFTSVKDRDGAQNTPPNVTPAVDLAASKLLLQLQRPGNADESWLSRIGACLSACKLALHVTDARIVLFGGEYDAAWVLTESGGSVLTDGWGRLFGTLSEQADAVAIIRGFLQQFNAFQRPAVPGTYPSVKPTGGGGSPDLASIVCRPAHKALQLGPFDMLVLPVRQGCRLVAALALGGFSQDATVGAKGIPGRQATISGGGGGGADGGSGADLHLDSSALTELTRVAQILAFGILGTDPGHAKFLSTAADHLGQLPLRQSLAGLVAGVLQAVSELLALRFAVQLQPVFALTHGQGGGRAVLFTARGGGGGANVAIGPTAANPTAASIGGAPGHQRDLLLETHASVQSLTALAANSTNLRRAISCRTGSGLSGHFECANSITDLSSLVKAVRISLANTLLGEALRMRPIASVVQGGELPANMLANANAKEVGSPAQQSFQHQQSPSPPPPPFQHQQSPSPPPPPPPQGHQRFICRILRDASGFVLDEQQPCRDILTIGKLLGGTVGSLALCLEAQRSATRKPSTDPPTLCSHADVNKSTTSKKELLCLPRCDGSSGGIPVLPKSNPVTSASCVGGLTSAAAATAHGGPRAGAAAMGAVANGRSACLEVVQVAVTGGCCAAPDLLEASDAQLYVSPVFALYLTCVDTLPESILQAVATEGKLLFGLLLDVIRASVATGGRVAVELRALQAQLLDQAGSWSAVPSLLQDRVAPAKSTQSTGKSVKRLISGAKLSKLSGAKMAAAAIGLMRSGSAHTVGVRPLISAATDTGVIGTAKSLLPLGPDSCLDMFDRAIGLATEGAMPQWMLASSPELALESHLPGPSQLEMLVSTMRSHLGSVVADAEAATDARKVLAQDLAALDLQELIGHGGQGVVFKGLLHGLETAVKLNVCRDGEPLEEDELNYAAEKAGAVYDTGGMIPTAELEELGARLRRAKRGAMEHAVMPTLSHPNIVQVYATFSNVVTVKCTYRHEQQHQRLCLVGRDDAILANMPKPGPLNQVICFEYCDCGTLLGAAHSGAFRPPGASAFSAIARPSLVPLYMSLLEVALALRYLHSRRLVHCDIKPSNVLLKGSNRDRRRWTCKLSDFGCTRLMTEISRPEASAANENKNKQQQQQQQQQQQCDPEAPPPTLLGFRMAAPLGTIAYMAPELFLRNQILTSAVDIYAFGIMMYELVTCRMPYTGLPPSEVPRHVVRWHLRPEFHPLAPSEYCSLATRCWSASPSRRPSASDLVAEIEKLLKVARKREEQRHEQTSCAVRQAKLPVAALPLPPVLASASASGGAVAMATGPAAAVAVAAAVASDVAADATSLTLPPPPPQVPSPRSPPHVMPPQPEPPEPVVEAVRQLRPLGGFVFEKWSASIAAAQNGALMVSASNTKSNNVLEEPL